MKYLYPFILIILGVMTVSNYVKLHAANNKIGQYDKVNHELQNDSKNYINSLVGYSSCNSDLNILLPTGDTINPTGVGSPGLFFFFSTKDCMTCVEENIFELIKLAKSSTTFSLYIVANKENSRYIKLLQRSNNIKNINYGISLDNSRLQTHHYFIALGNGEISNTYYPEKGNFGSTKKYLEHAKEIICNQISSKEIFH